ncbi:MAG: hypothetical protein K2O62_01110 [Clostridia bacterium]|nr:hypothetical protein [Clostridia bacterium]
MDLKEYMQQKADDPFLSDLSEEQKEYCREVEASYVEVRAAKPVMDKRKFWAFFSGAAAVLVAAVITIAVIFAPRKPLMYFDDKIVSEHSTIEALNNDSKQFKVNLIEYTTFDFSMSYDSDSGDKLYYEINSEGFFEKSIIKIVINKNYNYSFKELGETVAKPLNGYTLNYYVEESFDSTQYTGWIKLKTETVYITCTQKPSRGNEAFFTYVQSVIQAK